MSKGLLVRLPEQRTIVLGHYTLHAKGVEVKGKPSFEEHEDVGKFIQRAHRASGWWLADWLRYGDNRADWQERIEQAVDQSGLTEKTCKNVRAIGAIDIARRREDLPFALHDAVTSMSPNDQVIWLDKAAVEGWTIHELRAEIRASKRRKVIEGQAVLEGMYRVIYADPPWLYGDRGHGAATAVRDHYDQMAIVDICKLPVAAHALENSVLCLWATVPVLLQNPGPRDVLEAWGFTYKSARVWNKVLGNPGSYGMQVCHEELIIATRGSCLPDQPLPHDDSVFTERRSSVHSEKPAEGRKFIERHWTTGPYLELFASERTEGWDVFGNDARLWAQQAAV